MNSADPAAGPGGDIGVDGLGRVGAGGEEKRLARLREDILLTPSARARDGAPTWILKDPASGSFFHIGWREFEIISRWSLGTASEVVADIRRKTPLTISEGDVAGIEQFLVMSGLVRTGSADLLARAKLARQGWLSGPGKLLSAKVLFRKFPLFHPAWLLRASEGLAKIFFSRSFFLAMLAIFVVAGYLVMRDWTNFIASFSRFANLEVMVATTLILIIAKSLHEFAHAASAHRHGVEVPTMGVAFLLLWPVLYTETSDAWRLRDRKKRLEIAAAGLYAEAAISVFALLAWSFLDDGPWRDAALFGATTLIVLSVLFNANPLMKFDGYFMVCEWVGIDNLQDRAIGLFRWAISRRITGVRAPCPEAGFDRSVRLALIAFGLACVLYRLVLFTGIATAIYHFADRTIALPVGLALLVSFVFVPFGREVARWFMIAWKGGKIVGIFRVIVFIAVALAPLFIPWRASLDIPVIYRGGTRIDIFAPEPARIDKGFVRNGMRVAEGDRLVSLKSQDLDYALSKAIANVRQLRHRLDLHLTGVTAKADHAVYETELARLREELRSLLQRREKLSIAAPISGRVMSLKRGLLAGLWVSPGAHLMQIIAEGGGELDGYVDEADFPLLKTGAAGRLWFDGEPSLSYAIRVEQVHDEAVPQLTDPLLATRFGGQIRAVKGNDGSWIPSRGLFRVRLAFTGEVRLPTRVLRGYATIEAGGRSLFSRLRDKAIFLWRREFG